MIGDQKHDLRIGKYMENYRLKLEGQMKNQEAVSMILESERE